MHNLCFSLILGITAVPREIENNAYAKFFFWGGGEGEGREWGKANKVLYGRCASGVFMYFLNIFFFFQSRVATQERRSISLPLYMDLVHGPHIHAIATRPFVSGDVGRAKAHVPAWVSTLIALKGQENST